jgi:hypothetical protein
MAGAYVLISTLVLLFPQIYTWYIFYYLPKSYNASILASKKTQVDLNIDLSLGDADAAMNLIGEMKKNIDPNSVFSRS